MRDAFSRLWRGAGGGGEGVSTPRVSSQPPVVDNSLLAFTTCNVGRVADYPLWSTELLFRLGQLVSEDIATAPGQPPRGGCPGSGQLQRAWINKDGRGHAGRSERTSAACRQTRHW